MNRVLKHDPRAAVSSHLPDPGILRPQMAGGLGAEKQPAPSQANWAYSNSNLDITQNGDGQRPLGGRTKRLMDIVVASIALIVLSPLMLMVAAVIKLSIGGPVIFAHWRIGYGGRSFKCYKFRTMPHNADEMLSQYLASNPEAEREWKQHRKLKNDPRVTSLGRLLRKSSIDELPQLLNVLFGDMSCVGPRPIVREELDYYGLNALTYLKVRPGLTGLWQVSGRNKLNLDQRIIMDCDYVSNWSVWLDVRILAATASAVINSDETS
jgi:exopolysaccharide production protein ExoY